MGFIDREVSPTGLVTDIGFEDGKMMIRYMQRTQEAHELNQLMRNDAEMSKEGIRKGFWKVCHITEADCMKMLVEDGFDAYKASAKELRAHLSRHRDKYGHLFTTAGRV